MRCAPPANKPTIEERDTCRPYLARELALLANASVYVALGAFAYEALCRVLGVRPRPKFGHGVEVSIDGGRTILCSFHPSQQNTFTGKLTEPMLDAVFHPRLVGRLGTRRDMRRQVPNAERGGGRRREELQSNRAAISPAP